MDPIFPRELSSLFLGMPDMMSDISSVSSSATTTTTTTNPSLPLPPIPIPPPASGSKGRRKSNYSMEFKLQVLTWAKNTSFNAASRQFQVDRKVVKDWVESELEIRKFIEEGQEFRKRLSGAGKKAQDGGLETHLVTWINSHGTEKHLVSRTMIQAEALRYSQNKDFKASKGWLDRFLRRNQNAIGRKIKESGTSSSSQSQCLSSSTATSTSADTPSTFTPSFSLEQLLTSAASADLKSQNQTNSTELSSKLAPMNASKSKSLSFGGKATGAGAGLTLPPPKNICVNCCERLPAINDSLSRPNNVVREIRTCITPSSNSFGLQINPQIESSRSLTLDQEIIARVKVNHVLASLYKLNFIDQLNAKKSGTSCRRRYRDKNRIRNLQWSLCRRCGTTLTDLYKLYNDFNSFRKADSILANLINELDDCIHTFSQNVQNNSTSNSNTNNTSAAEKNKMAGGGGGEDLEVDGGGRHIFMNQTIFEGDGDDNDDDDLEDEMDNSDLYEHGQLPFAMIMTTNPNPNPSQSTSSKSAKKLPPAHSNLNLQSDLEESRESSDTFPSDEQEFKYDPDNDNDNESIDLKVFSPSHGEEEGDEEENPDEDGGGEETFSNENIEEEEEEEEGPLYQSQAECGQGGGGGGGSKKRKTSRSLEFKLQVIEWAKTNTTSTTSRKFDVPRKCIQEWKKNESLIRQIVATSDGKKRRRLTGFVEKKDKFKKL